nr:hypothetical protein StreXyl84_31410 [Streptomyces sp. Xyl84]
MPCRALRAGEPFRSHSTRACFESPACPARTAPLSKHALAVLDGGLLDGGGRGGVRVGRRDQGGDGDEGRAEAPDVTSTDVTRARDRASEHGDRPHSDRERQWGVKQV